MNTATVNHFGRKRAWALPGGFRAITKQVIRAFNAWHDIPQLIRGGIRLGQELVNHFTIGRGKGNQDAQGDTYGVALLDCEVNNLFRSEVIESCDGFGYCHGKHLSYTPKCKTF